MAELGFSWHDFPIALPFPTLLILLQGKQKPREQKCLHKAMWQMSGGALDVNPALVNYCFVTNISCQTSDLKLPWIFISHDLVNWLASPPADFAGLTHVAVFIGRLMVLRGPSWSRSQSGSWFWPGLLGSPPCDLLCSHRQDQLPYMAVSGQKWNESRNFKDS